MSETRAMQTMTMDEFRAAIEAQGVPNEHVAFRCPRCDTVQSMTSLVRAGAGETPESVERFIGFSCVGRWTDAGSPAPNSRGKGCDWTLGGLFRLHKLEVMTEDGTRHPYFEVATREQAQALMAEHLALEPVEVPHG